MRKMIVSLLIVLGFGGISLALAMAHPDQDYLRGEQFKPLFDQLFEQVQQKFPDRMLSVANSGLPASLQPELKKKLAKWQQDHPGKGTPQSLSLSWNESENESLLSGSLAGQSFEARKQRLSWVNALPPIVTITAALLTQNLILSLFLGILLGSILAAGGNPLIGTLEVFSKHGWAAVADVFHIQILVFSGLLLGMVGVMNVSGGTRGIVAALQKFISDRRSTKLMTGIMGLLIFFDDYANCFVIGTTLRPATDQHKISREKLAYLVDTTAAPVATLAIVSTWIGYQLGLITDSLAQISGEHIGAFQAFMAALPLRYYCLMTLGLMFLVILMRRDFGPMYQAERRALEQGLVLRDGAVPLTTRTFSGLDAKPGIPLRWQNAAFPVLMVVAATLIGLYLSGNGAAVLAKDWHSLFSLQSLGDVFAQAQSGPVLLWSSGLGCALAMLMALPLLKPREIGIAWLKGVSAVTIATVILIMTWTMSHITSEIGTATYLVALFRDLVQPMWLAMALFLLAAAIAFSIGSSWSTMALMIPVALPLAHEVGGMPLMVLTLGAVLDGCIFGDHCSPLADTTILTAIACSSDLIDHVRTQLPYGLLALATAALLCYLPAAAGLPPWLLIPLGLAAMALFLRAFGRNPEADAHLPDTPKSHIKQTDPRVYME
ncbi:MAG: Na+/H+ antiporter NhaC family protein [Candidatus Sericytochromatia bacterium]